MSGGGGYDWRKRRRGKNENDRIYRNSNMNVDLVDSEIIGKEVVKTI